MSPTMRTHGVDLLITGALAVAAILATGITWQGFWAAPVKTHLTGLLGFAIIYVGIRVCRYGIGLIRIGIRGHK